MTGLTHAAEAITWASLQASVIVGLVLLTQRALGSRVHPRWHYMLWGLVLVRLLAPVLPETRWSIFNFWAAPVPQTAAQHEPPSPPAGWAIGLEPGLTSAPTTTAADPPINTGPTNSDAAAETSAGVWAFDFVTVFAGVWLLVALMLLTRLLVSYLLLLKRIGSATRVTDPGLLELMDRCRARMRVKTKLPLIETDAVTCPALLGLFRPKLLVPPGMLNRLKYRQIALVMMHELAHHRARDLAVNWLLSAVTAVYWFNPIMWWAARRIIADQEIARDADVVDGLQVLDRVEYGRALISMTRAGGLPPSSP